MGGGAVSVLSANKKRDTASSGRAASNDFRVGEPRRSCFFFGTFESQRARSSCGSGGPSGPMPTRKGAECDEHQKRKSVLEAC